MFNNNNGKNAGYQVVFKSGTFGWKFPGSNLPGLDLERSLVDFMLVKGLATNPSGDCCTLVSGAAGIFNNGLLLTEGLVQLGGELVENTTIEGGTGDFSMTFDNLANFLVDVTGASANSQLWVSGTVAQPSRLTHVLGSNAAKVAGVYLDVDFGNRLVFDDGVNGEVGFLTTNDAVGNNSGVLVQTKNVRDGVSLTRQFLRYDSASARSEYEFMTFVPNIQVANYTLVLSDADKIIQMNVAGANNLTIPLNASVAFPIGTHIYIKQYGAGTTTIVSGAVTLRSRGGLINTNGQYAVVELIKLGTDEWSLSGDRA